MSEVQSSAKQRKFSLGGVSHASSGSQPTTPLAENGPWETSSTSTTRPTTGNPGHLWTPQIWNKDRPSRIAEIKPSRTGSFHDDMRSPTSTQGVGLPFEIPLEPNRKAVRSQSYSAGQLEKIGIEQQLPGYSRVKTMAPRASRGNLLGDAPRDVLSSLQEDEDDTENSSGSDDILCRPPRA